MPNRTPMFFYIEAGLPIPGEVLLARSKQRSSIYRLRKERDKQTLALFANYLDLLPSPRADFVDGWLKALDQHWGDLVTVAGRGRGGRWAIRQLKGLGYRSEKGNVTL